MEGFATAKDRSLAAGNVSVLRSARRDRGLGMLKSVHLGSYPLLPEQYQVVTSFFRAIGFDLARQARDTILLAPQGALTVRESRPKETGPASGGRDRVALHIAVDVSNPEVIRDIAERMKLAVHSGNSRSGGRASFSIELPGKLWVDVRETSDEPVAEQGTFQAQGKRFAIVVSRFNAFITERLLSGAQDALCRSGAGKNNITVVRVPGAFEIPAAARALAASGHHDAVICLGCLLRGDTVHYDVIASEVTRGIGQSAQETGVPHAFGVLTCDSLEQAIDRAGLKMGNKGFEAALAAIEMANLTQAVGMRGSASPGRGKAIHSKPAPFGEKRGRARRIAGREPTASHRSRRKA